MKGPLGLPPGSVRDLVTLILVCGFTYGFVVGRIPSEQFAIAVMGVLGVNGVMRQADKQRGEDRPPPASPPREPEGRGKG